MVLLDDVGYYLEPVDVEDSSLTSAHYVIVADSLRTVNTSCGMQRFTAISK